MFSGIIETLGEITQVERRDKNLVLSVKPRHAFLKHLSLGSSVSLAGVCLTIFHLEAESFSVELSTETQSCTTLGDLDKGQLVNLENALKVGDTLDGHLVSGHIDATACIVERNSNQRNEIFTIESIQSLKRFITPKGAICLDGVSLTVNQVSGTRFQVNVIPYTLKNTTFSLRKPGDKLNLEVDMIARYVASFLNVGPDHDDSC